MYYMTKAGWVIILNIVFLISCLPVTLLLMLGLAVAVIGIYFMNWAVFFLPGLCIYGLTFPMEWMLRKMMPEVPEDSEEAQKWYYR